MNPLTQMIHSGQMLLPQGIQHLQHDLLFNLAHIRAHCLALTVVSCLHGGGDFLPQGFFMELVILLQPLRQGQGDGEFRLQLLFQTGNIPLLLHTQGRYKAINSLPHHILANGGDSFRDIGFAQQFIALLVDDLALVIGDIIVFQQLLADIKVAALYLALRFFNGIGNHAVFNGLAFLHTQGLHEAFHPI